jgi:hypothetical protein
MTSAAKAAIRPELPTIVRATARWQRKHYLIIAGIALIQMCIRAEVPLGQDMLWGARFGVDFFDTGHLAHTDSYSWTAHGHEWVPNSWAWNVVLGAAYRMLGVTGFWLLGAVLAVLMSLAVARIAQRLGAHPKATLAVYAPVGLLGLAAVPRAQTASTIALLVVPLLVVRLVESDAHSQWRPLALLILTQLAWINIHSAALITPVLVACCGGAMLTAGRHIAMRAAATRVALGTAGTALACIATPYGLAPVTHVNDVRASSVGLMTEWDHVGFATLPQILGLLAVVGAAGLSWSVWRSGRAATAAAVVVLTCATAGAIRFLPMLAVLAAPEAALLIGRLEVRPRMFTAMVGATTAVLAAFGVLNARDLRSLGDTVSPGLIAALPAHCRLLNDDLAGDAVPLLRKDVLVSLDDRNDMYGRKMIIEIENLFLDRPGTDAVLRRDRVNCVLGPTPMPLVRRLTHSSAWFVAGRDSVRTLLVRAPGAQP